MKTVYKVGDKIELCVAKQVFIDNVWCGGAILKENFDEKGVATIIEVMSCGGVIIDAIVEEDGAASLEEDELKFVQLVENSDNSSHTLSYPLSPALSFSAHNCINKRPNALQKGLEDDLEVVESDEKEHTHLSNEMAQHGMLEEVEGEVEAKSITTGTLPTQLFSHSLMKRLRSLSLNVMVCPEKELAYKIFNKEEEDKGWWVKDEESFLEVVSALETLGKYK